MPNRNDAARLNLTVSGPEGGTPVIFVHPLGVDLRFWDECRTLWPQRRTVAYDQRGAGGSPAGPSPLTLDHQISDLGAVIAETASTGAILAGTAYGAMIAAAYAARHPGHVRGLILTNATSRFSDATLEINRQRLATAKERGIAALLPGVADAAFADLPRDERYRRYCGMFASNSAEGYAAAIAGAMQADITGDLAAIRCPAIVVAGEADRLMTPEQSRALHERLARSDFHLLPGAAHFAPYQNPKGFVALAEDFLTRHGL